ncbi:hypothetical protein MIND_01113600 [Mycena indigotica]|uniref:Uncharacterized protein n=1 Tax=Mycena indigotica TaxID=2126181 RepID=A0A8H6SA11_9AGAR|nr:uncharacterized protein MIND_01113600 [Mycena indigotica]KAF7295730.1 hypothetical protein MIND_01113600 [Mycena indigotica]
MSPLSAATTLSSIASEPAALEASLGMRGLPALAPANTRIAEYWQDCGAEWSNCRGLALREGMRGVDQLWSNRASNAWRTASAVDGRSRKVLPSPVLHSTDTQHPFPLVPTSVFSVAAPRHHDIPYSSNSAFLAQSRKRRISAAGTGPSRKTHRVAHFEVLCCSHISAQRLRLVKATSRAPLFALCSDSVGGLY